MEQMLHALSVNFEGEEVLRQRVLNHTPLRQ